jgi:hypothetical protein
VNWRSTPNACSRPRLVSSGMPDVPFFNDRFLG